LLHDRPVYVHWAVTSRCNLRCRSCTIWERNSSDELCGDDITALANVLAEIGCIQVSLGGGEPALRNDLVTIVSTLLDRGIRTRVLTNGVALVPDLARELLDAGLREFSFSLDSLDPAVQEGMDNTPGAFGKRLRNLAALAEMLPERGCLPMLNTVVTPHNFRELPAIVTLAGELGFHASLIPIHLPPCADDEHRFYGQAPELRFDPESAAELRTIYRELIDLKRRGGPIINSSTFLERSPDYLLDGHAEWPCRAGELFFSISPQGRVAPCHAFEDRWEMDFRELPDRLGTTEYRDQLTAKIAQCEGCFRPCWAEISLLMLEARALGEMLRVQASATIGRRRVDTSSLHRKLESVPGAAS
jgi:MoaA/NifB/PqqE/SkfB family radical SAM enzyme